MKTIYGIMPITVSRGLNKVYNKQLIMAKYEYNSTARNSRGAVRPKFLEMIPITGTQKQADSKKNSFDVGYIAEIEVRGDIGETEIHTGVATSDNIVFYETEELARISKYIYMGNIKEYFDEKLRDIRNTMEANLPKNLEEKIADIEDKYPEYFV